MATTNQVDESTVQWLSGKTIAFIGDSITADLRWNYVTLLVDRLATALNVGDIDVVNAAIDSSSIADCLDRLPEFLTEHDPDIVSVFVGVNDSKVFRYADRPLLSLGEFTDIYSAFLGRLDVPHERTKVLVTMPPLLFERVANSELLREYWYWRPEEYDQYNDAIRVLARERKCRLADVARSFACSEESLEDFFDDDGVHPNLRGHRLIADAVLRALSKGGAET